LNPAEIITLIDGLSQIRDKDLANEFWRGFDLLKTTPSANTWIGKGYTWRYSWESRTIGGCTPSRPRWPKCGQTTRQSPLCVD